MATIQVQELRSDLSFGAIVEGVDRRALSDPAVEADLKALFETRGLIVFAGLEPSQEMHLALSNAFGPLRQHAIKALAQVDRANLPGVLDMHWQGREDNGDHRGLVEMDGKLLARYVPWHFDACYTDRLNRAGVLRALACPPEGGRTGFLDGVAMYRQMPADLRRRIEGQKVIYTFDTRLSKLRFGRNFKDFGEPPEQMALVQEGQTMPRAIHPAVWTRPDGEKVLHVGVQFAVGLEHCEDPEGDALLEAVCQWITREAPPYWHEWRPDQMLIWDNWRFVHMVEGFDQKFERRTQRTTIEGDYGLGRLEAGKTAGEAARELRM